MQLEAVFEKAQTLSSEDFEHRLNELEARIGFEPALKVMHEGDVLEYTKAKFHNEYLRIADLVCTKIDQCAPPVPAFYSVDSLRAFFSTTIDFSKITHANYRLLHDDPKSHSYLNALANDGILQVDGNDHWNTSATGPRGGSILRIIDHQLMLLFNDLGFGHPKIRHYPNQRKMVLDEKTQEYVRQVCDYVSTNKK